ncbi:UNVERIFIED_CONTAM: hypothetical protein Slati_1394100 [Sesamum latifolium]|uniref:Uncharacterized protein n=1 Tax=Sesamum latifolium TaxID=2727402 RepID=A0AAW2X2C6_9LAMI
MPWSFEKNTLILNSIEKNENPLHVDLDWCDFYVHIHDLPLSKMNLGVARLIGTMLGRFWDMEMEESGMMWGSSLRIRVAINVTQSITQVLRVCTTMWESYWCHLHTSGFRISAIYVVVWDIFTRTVN